MSCTSPIYAFQERYVFTKNNKHKIVILRKAQYEELMRDGEIRVNNKLYRLNSTNYELIQLPCGRCDSCRLSKSKEWMQRCMLEQKQWIHNEMLTLTYNDEHLPKSYRIIDEDTGDVEECSTLCKQDVVAFLKRLRRHYKYHYNQDNIRFFMCGEYGERRGRPHYHLILFNFDVKDKKYYKKSKKGFDMFHSKEIEQIWSKGHIELNDVTPETCAYVARYVLKKQKGPGSADYYEKSGLVPEYVNCSRKPGIGYDYYIKNKDSIYEYDKIFIVNNKGLQKLKPSSYYDRLYDADDTDMMTKIKDRRKELAKQRQDTLNVISGLSDKQQQEYKANAIRDKIKYLQRGFESSGL